MLNAENLPQPLIGHTTTVLALAALLAENKLPHALMLHGLRGIGKALLAHHLAWRLICGPAAAAEEGPNMFGETAPATPSLAFDTNAPQAHQIAAGSCPDFHHLAPENGKKSIGVKPVLQVLEDLRRTADTARVVLIDSLDDLTEEAANMLLKSLEEPRPGIFFILVAHQLGRILPTIRSRCRLLRLAPLTLAETTAVLHQQAAENPADLANSAHGAPGTVLGEANQKRQSLQSKLASWLAGQGPAPSPSERENFAPLLANLLATSSIPATLTQAQAYTQLQDLAAKQAEINLPLAWTNAAALALVNPVT